MAKPKPAPLLGFFDLEEPLAAPPEPILEPELPPEPPVTPEPVNASEEPETALGATAEAPGPVEVILEPVEAPEVVQVAPDAAEVLEAPEITPTHSTPSTRAKESLMSINIESVKTATPEELESLIKAIEARKSEATREALVKDLQGEIAVESLTHLQAIKAFIEGGYKAAKVVPTVASVNAPKAPKAPKDSKVFSLNAGKLFYGSAEVEGFKKDKLGKERIVANVGKGLRPLVKDIPSEYAAYAEALTEVPKA